ncbi:MAG: hypothetical protein DMF62_04995 [Acidobacteria bacterium]|nr:MAG: hypothetical protein DMF62_04995 [Acidobacteriota bacterium]
MTDEEVAAMNAGQLIQIALEHWPAEQREMLITGIHPKCWEEMMAEDDDDTPLDGRMDLL